MFIQIIIMGLLFGSSPLFAQSIEQSVIASSGLSVQTGGIQLDFTVGETCVTSLEAATIVLNQGFQQNALIATGLKGLPANISLKVYPNPFERELWITLEGPDLNFWVQLYDISGRPLREAKYPVQASGYWQQHIDFSRHPSGSYLVVITSLKGEWLSIYKLIKP
ncbi:T9SS type A sorting domain-containing protein [Rapidithrix thailandica]